MIANYNVLYNKLMRLHLIIYNNIERRETGVSSLKPDLTTDFGAFDDIYFSSSCPTVYIYFTVIRRKENFISFLYSSINKNVSVTKIP